MVIIVVIIIIIIIIIITIIIIIIIILVVIVVVVIIVVIIIIKRVFYAPVNTYVRRGVDARGAKNYEQVHTHTRGTTTVTTIIKLFEALKLKSII